jgi:hypothetical protein
VTNYAPRPGQLPTRDEAIKAALHYPAGLNAAKTFADVNAPFAADAYRSRSATEGGSSTGAARRVNATRLPPGRAPAFRTAFDTVSGDSP